MWKYGSAQRIALARPGSNVGIIAAIWTAFAMRFRWLRTASVGTPVVPGADRREPGDEEVEGDRETRPDLVEERFELALDEERAHRRRDAARAERSQERDDERRARRQVEADTIARPETQPAQVVG